MNNISFLKSVDVVISRYKRALVNNEIVDTTDTYLEFIHIYVLASIKVTLSNKHVIEGSLIDFNVEGKHVKQLIVEMDYYNSIIDVEDIIDIEVIEEDEYDDH